MEKLSQEIVRSIFEAAGEERRDLEFKPVFGWNDPRAGWVKEKTIRAVIGMSNTKGGGHVVAGVNEVAGHQLDFVGLTQETIDSFSNIEQVKGVIDGFVYGFLELDLRLAQHDGKDYVVFIVSEFDEVPNLCKKNGDASKILVKDDLYVRSKTSPPSTIKATDLEMREILRLTADKERRQLRARGFIKKTSADVIAFYAGHNRDLE